MSLFVCLFFSSCFYSLAILLAFHQLRGRLFFQLFVENNLFLDFKLFVFLFFRNLL